MCHPLLMCVAVSSFLPFRSTSRLVPGVTSGVAAQAPIGAGVAELLTKASSAYTALRTYEHTEVVSQSGSDEAAPVYTMSYQFAIQKSGKLRFRVSGASGATISTDDVYCDGLRLVCYRASRRMFVRKPAPRTLAEAKYGQLLPYDGICSAIIARLTGGHLAVGGWLQRFSGAERGHTPTDHGTSFDTLVIKSEENGFTGKTIYYFGSSTHLLQKVTVDTSGTIGGRAVASRLTATVTKMHLNPSIPASEFTFNPPHGATEAVTFDDPAVIQAQNEAIARFVGRRAPDFAVKYHDGRTTTLAALKGHVVVIDFWASWCGPCVSVLPVLREVSERYAASGVTLLLVDSWEGTDACDAFIKGGGAPASLVAVDPAGPDAAASVASTLFGVDGIPTTIVIDKEGVIRTYAIGAHDRAFYLDALKNVGINVDRK